jgi:phosphatidylserine/phosphatidylglycerophosphate/cardiolipin synthase-like enzyme
MAGACQRARNRIDIASPFLSVEVAAYLVRACDEGRARDRRFITALNGAAVEGGYLDPDAVDELIAAGLDARSLRNLHAKALIADGSWALIGSGNLTVAGANGGNAELGAVLSPAQSRTAQREFFDRWWARAEPLNARWMRSIRRHAPRRPERRRREGHGGLFQVSGGVDLGGFSANKVDSGYWLKIQYTTEAHMTARYWQRRTWISDRHTEPPRVFCRILVGVKGC